MCLIRINAQFLEGETNYIFKLKEQPLTNTPLFLAWIAGSFLSHSIAYVDVDFRGNNM